LNVTPTLRLAFSSTVHVGPNGESQPDQLPNVKPLLGAAVSVTDVPVGKLALQVDPQLIPGGTLVTTPVPVPEATTVRVDPPLAHPELVGPWTVTLIVPVITFPLGLLVIRLAVMPAVPQLVVGLTLPVLLTCAT
jgi:hypothetical protein